MRKLLVLTIVVVAALIVVAPRFRQWSTDRAEGRVGSAGLRLAVLQRKFVGATSAADSDEVKCVVMDWNLGGETVATLVAFADGTTSLYLTSGGGILGAGSHENVREAAARFRALAADRADQFSTTAVRTMTQAQVDSAVSTLNSVATRLEGTAASIQQPVPPGPPPAPVTT